MTLTVETGSNIAGANSFVTLADVQAFAVARGRYLASDMNTLESQVVQAADYLNGMESRLLGYRTYANQPMCYPRYGVELYGFSVGSTEIPQVLKDAQCALVLELNAGADFYNREQRKMVTQETISGAVSVSYAEPKGVGAELRRASDVLLNVLTGGSSSQIRVMRA